jgi:hypothetical protein
VPEPFPSQRSGERFELVSRGDIVPGRLWSSGAGARPHALVLIVPALETGKDASEVAALGCAVAAQGWLAAAVDLPLQGERASAKLSPRLAACAAAEPRAELDRLLWGEFLHQSALDLAAALERLRRGAAAGAECVACVAYASAAAAVAAWAARAPDLVVLRAERDAAPDALVARLRDALAGR